jgi:hypothetical protein
MASEPDQHSTPASFYESPQAARHARPEEFLCLACMHEGTGADEPDFLAVVDAQDGRVVHETPMPTWATSCITSAGIAAARRVTGPIARI